MFKKLFIVSNPSEGVQVVKAQKRWWQFFTPIALLQTSLSFGRFGGKPIDKLQWFQCKVPTHLPPSRLGDRGSSQAEGA